MKTLTILAAVLTATSTLLAQNIKPSRQGPTYDSNGHLIKYVYADGTRELYSYDSQGGMSAFTDRAGKVTHFSNNSNSASPVPLTAKPDQTLYTTYSGNSTTVDWVVCGSLPQTEGCFSAGSLGPFAKVGAMLEGNPTVDTSTNTVTRAIYILDIASGTNMNGVTLYVYQKTDMISPSFDTVTVTLTNTVSLPLTGGTSALPSMAANTKFLFIGTNQSPQAVEVTKKNLHFFQIGGFSPPINVASITADQYGYVTVTFGSSSTAENGFYVFGPNGDGEEDGGGFDFMLDTVQGILPSTFP